jgi:hypothetical protein
VRFETPPGRQMQIDFGERLVHGLLRPGALPRSAPSLLPSSASSTRSAHTSTP